MEETHAYEPAYHDGHDDAHMTCMKPVLSMQQVPAGSVSAHEAVVAGVVDVAMEPAAAAAIHGDREGFSLMLMPLDRSASSLICQQDRACGQFLFS